jgi:hypothetical protein
MPTFLPPPTIPFLLGTGFSLLKFVLNPRAHDVEFAVDNVARQQVLNTVADFVNVYNTCYDHSCRIK